MSVPVHGLDQESGEQDDKKVWFNAPLRDAVKAGTIPAARVDDMALRILRGLIDNQKIPGITGAALDSNEGLPGPLVLQGSEVGQVKYRNIVVMPAR